ncbi:RpnC/YadD family protein [Aminicella lysinilytica]|uniref:Putative transposase/invertase (TIGR01784 family) n=1 Tax=Aminicella lysinilytica TaxID=433323 RepID=A0A4R6Q884_9FIRM|nr:hypothetical protein [Aminicella lysinilytica]TDP58461.1 putative transposase/invertase (TIGR01784 family) [Aminicella lysinilytica]
MHTLEDKINERYRAGFSEGKDAGFSEGKLNGKKSTALAMMAKGFEIPLISEITGLSKDEIEKLK